MPALRHGVAAAIEHERLLNSLYCRTIVDIGANCGQFALVARHCFPDSMIVSFEPLSSPAAKFRKIFARDERTILHQVAIGLRSEEKMIHVSQRDDSSSLLPISSTQTDIFPGTQEIDTIKVRVAPLEEFISTDKLRPSAMLKLDVQGFEHEALIGCESLLNYFTFVYCECSFLELYSGQKLASEIVDWLSARGFNFTGIYNTYYDKTGRAIQGDFLFNRKS